MAKGTRARTVLPAFIDKKLAGAILTEGRHGVTWLPQHAKIVPQDGRNFQGSYGVVRRVAIWDVAFIPEYLEFAGKTMKPRNSLENRKERSLEALACPVDHPGVIKVQYLNMNTHESYSLSWNGGSVRDMRVYHKSVPEEHESELLLHGGVDYESLKQLVVYQKNRVYLAWALMCIVNIVYKHNVRHNDISSNNVMLHFPQNREDAVFIGLCDWGMAT